MSEIYGSIITKNEEQWIGTALSSMVWMKQVFLVDNGSSDRTLDIASKFKNVSIERVAIDLPHCVAEQRNLSIEKIPKDAWVYFADSDEFITSDLRGEIKRFIHKGSYRAFQIPRVNFFLGKALKHGGWYPDYQVRLVHMESLVKWVNAPLNVEPILYYTEHKNLLETKFGPHDKPLLKDNTEVGRLTNPYLHFNHRSMLDMMSKTPRFLQSELSYLVGSGSKIQTNYFKIACVPINEFVKRFFFKLGLLDGVQGLIESIYMSYSAFLFECMKWESINNIDRLYSDYKKKLKEDSKKIKK